MNQIRGNTLALLAALSLAACGGGGGGGGGGGAAAGGGGGSGASNGGTSSSSALVVPARYAPTSYTIFSSSRGVTDLTGTWVLLIQGNMVDGETIAVSGKNYTESYAYVARSVVRIKADPAVVGGYIVHSCGPGGARETTSVFSSVDSTIYLPYFYYSSANYDSYKMKVVNATTIQNTSVTRPWSYYGSAGNSMSYQLQFSYKRISDDPTKKVSNLMNLQSSVSTENGCFYEAEGNYLVTENDAYVSNLNQSGSFYRAIGYPVSPLTGVIGGYGSQFFLEDLVGYRRTYKKDHVFPSVISYTGSEVMATRTTTANNSSYIVHAIKNGGGFTEDVQLDVAP